MDFTHHCAHDDGQHGGSQHADRRLPPCPNPPSTGVAGLLLVLALFLVCLAGAAWAQDEPDDGDAALQTAEGTGDAAVQTAEGTPDEALQAVKTIEEGTGEGWSEPLPYYLYVEKGSATITMYGLDDQGEYTEVLHTWATAIGRTAGRTPTGLFTLGDRERWHRFSDSAFVQYATHYGRYLYIHSSLYGSEDIDHLYPGDYQAIGDMVTSGCLRTTAVAAYTIYKFCPPGTIVEIVNGSPRGFTSDGPPAMEYRQWGFVDPTDPEHPRYDEQ